jgi:hypothetical protein
MDLLASAHRHEDTCRRLRSALPAAWRFDPVFCAVAAALAADEVDDAATTVAALLPTVLDRAAVAVQPSPVVDVVRWAGGLEGSQRLFMGSLDGGVTLFSSLWPWAEGDGCTLRVGLFHDDARADDRSGFEQLLRSWFLRDG